MISPASASNEVPKIEIMEGLRALVLDDNSDDGPTPQQGSPIIVITPPSAELMVSQQPRQPSAPAVARTPRPRLRRNAATAPPGALHLYSGIEPQPPRRAISTRTPRSLQSSPSRQKRSPVEMPPHPQFPPFGTSVSRSLICRRKSNKRPSTKTDTDTKHSTKRTPHQSTKKFQLLSEALSDRPVSFSDKVKVTEKLKTKKMKVLKTQFAGSPSKDLPGTPLSMVATPEELYGPDGSGRGLSPATAYQAEHMSFMWSEPTRRAKHFSLPLTPSAQRRDSFHYNKFAPYEDPSQRTVYIPGPIELEENIAATPRKGSIASMSAFEPGLEPSVKRFSDMVALDGVVMFFEDLGMWKPATEECLDRHWVDKRANRLAITPRRAAPTVPLRPPIPSAASRAFHSATRALQHEERSHDGWPTSPGRPKGKLRQLLESSRKKL